MNKLAAIQMLRAIAAVLVVLAHAIERQAQWQQTDQWVTETARLAGAIGVWIFFIISGFIMSYTYYDKFGVAGAAGRFVASRIVRIVPIYWLATALEVVLRLRHGTEVDVHKLICSLFFIPIAVEPGPMAAMRPILGVGWTLNYEMMFYACFASVLFLPRRRGLTVLLLGVAGLVLTGTFFKPLSDTRDPTSLMTFVSAPIVLLFGAGVLIGTAARQHAGGSTVRRSGLLLTALVAALTAPLVVFAIFGGAYPAAIAWLAVFWIVCAICVVLCVIVRTDDAGRFSQALVRLGDASYSLYLFHFFAILATEKLWWLLVGRSGASAFVLVCVAAAIVAAALINRFIETPMTDRLRRSLALVKARRSGQKGNAPRFGATEVASPSGTTYLPDIAHGRSR
jgi:exopolysaccharide production protein ExoZ